MTSPPHTTTSNAGEHAPSFPAAPDEDLEHQRILAAAGAALFGGGPLCIDHYVIERQIGSGGMGEVFLAHDEVLERRVAIKLLRRELTRGRAGAALEHEAKQLARLSHPHVVQVHALGHYGERAYLVMEYVEGSAMSRWLAETHPGWQAILAAFAQAGQGLAAAHACGLVHRDVKPHNMLVGREGRVRMLDFGLAEHDDEARGSWAGTPRYMAPEQFEGRLVDARSDQFAFCVALAEALWGRPLRDAETEPPDSVVPGWVWRVLRRGLRHDPSRRWPDMPSLLTALDPRPRRVRARVAAGLLVAAGLTWLAWPEPLVEDPCVLLERELDERWLADHGEPLRVAADTRSAHERDAAAQLLAALDEWSTRWRATRVRVCRTERRGDGPSSRATCLTRQREHVAALLELAAAQPELLAIYVRELAELPEPEACERDDPGTLPPDPAIASEVAQLRSLVDRSAAARKLGQAEVALPGLETALGRAEQLGYAPLEIELAAELAVVELLAGDRASGLARLRRAARLAYVQGDDRLAASLWLDLAGQAEDLAGPEAAASLERAADASLRVGADPAARARLALVSGTLALARGELDVAERELAGAYEGPQPRLRPFVLERQAELALAREQPELALSLREQARDSAIESFGPDHPRTAEQRYNLALEFAAHERVEAAERELASAITAWKRAHARPHPDLVLAHVLAAQLALARDAPDAALREAERALELANELGEGELEARQQAWDNLGHVHHARGELESALDAYAQALALAESLWGPNHPWTSLTALNHAILLLALGRLDASRVALEPLLAVDDAGVRELAGLALAELELREGQPIRTLERLAALPLESFAQPLDRLDHALLLALARLRTGSQPSLEPLERALSDAGADGEAALEQRLDTLAATAAERSMLSRGDRASDPPTTP